MARATQKMKSVNIVITDEIEECLTGKVPGDSRSARVRAVLAAILVANTNGDDAAFQCAMEKGTYSDWRVRKMTEEAGLAQWQKGIVWLPQVMHDRIETLISGSGLNVSDLVRGAVIGACEFDVEKLANQAGRIVWKRNRAAEARQDGSRKTKLKSKADTAV